MFKNSNFHVLRFLLVYALLSYGFYAYIGIVSPGGSTYSPFLHHYFDVPAWATYGISKSAKGALELAGYDVYQKRPDNVTIAGSRGVTILWACLGFGVISFWIAFVTAHKARWQYLLWWSLAGVGVITGINIIRIALIALANHHHWTAFQQLEPHRTFNIVSYVFIIALTAWFVVRYRREQGKSEPQFVPAA